jgi:homoserine kinase
MGRPAFRAGPVHVRAPATSANLGPGFDSLGLALGLYDDVVARVADAGLVVDVAGEGADVARDEGHLVVRAMRAAFERLGGQPHGLELSCANRIPHSRGLGSSAAAIVAGVVLARALVLGGAEQLPDAELLALAGELEGHPDNVAASLNGGFVICADGQATRFEPPTGLEALAVVPREAVRTSAARAALDGEVALPDAVFNVAHAAVLTLGLALGDWDMLARGLQDRLHQQQRAELFPRSYELAMRARELGALGATISGAGPTVLVWCFYEQTGSVAEALRGEIDGWATLLRAPFEPQGAYVAEL